MESTGHSVLDEAIGGLKRPMGIELTGPIGSGKSVLARYITAHLLTQDYYVMYFAIDETSEEIREGIRSRGVDIDKMEEEGRITFMDLLEIGIRKLSEYSEEEDALEVVHKAYNLREILNMGRKFTLSHMMKKQLYVMDSVTPFFLMEESSKVFQFIQTMRFAIRFGRALGIATLHSGVLDPSIENALISFADLVIEMKKSGKGTAGFPRTGSLKLLKGPKPSRLGTDYAFMITENELELVPGPVL